MLYNLLAPYKNNLHLANLFTYISFRSGLAILVSMSVCFLIGPKIIAYLRSVNKNGQPIREDGPASHFSKAGTPTMGGLIILSSTIICKFDQSIYLDLFICAGYFWRIRIYG
jgi:phospho-N-acetylmuramoyl-pentapeptide-transferase